MTTDVFSSWFDKFVKKITERPLLLIYDGHLTHVSIPVIELAMKENIIILKFPPHVTDVLQPLDVTCFGPLKRVWEKCLNKWVNQWGPKEPVKKAQFVNLLGEIWHDGLSKPNIQAGFSKTGIFPINREKFPVKRFDPRILARYERWVELGKPAEEVEELATAALTPHKLKKPNDASILGCPEISSTPVTSAPSKSITCYCHELGPIPTDNPPKGKRWKPVWSICDENINSSVVSNQSQSSLSQEDRSFEKLILDKMKGPTEKPAFKRRKIDLMTKVVTNEEYLQGIKNKLSGKKEKKKKPVNKAKEKVEVCKSKSDSDDDLVDLDRQEYSDENDGSEIDDSEKLKDCLKDKMDELVSNLDEDKVGFYYAVFYGDRYYWGKVTKAFSFDTDDDVEDVELTFLRYRGDGYFDFPKKPDVEIVNSKYLFRGPCKPNNVVKGKGFTFGDDELKAQEQFKQMRSCNIYL